MAFLGCSFANASETEWRSMAQSSQNCLGFPSTTTPCLWVPLPWFPCANPCAWRRTQPGLLWLRIAWYHIIYIHIYIYISGWWFGTFFIFPYIGNNNPNGLVFQTEGLKPTTRYMISIPLLELQAKTGILKPTKLGRWPNSLRREDKPWIFYGRGEVKAVPSGIHIYIYTYKIISKFRSSWNHD